MCSHTSVLCAASKTAAVRCWSRGWGRKGCKAAAQVRQAQACSVVKCMNEGVHAFMSAAIFDLRRKHVLAVTTLSLVYIPGGYFNLLALNAGEESGTTQGCGHECRGEIGRNASTWSSTAGGAAEVARSGALLGRALWAPAGPDWGRTEMPGMRCASAVHLVSGVGTSCPAARQPCTLA